MCFFNLFISKIIIAQPYCFFTFNFFFLETFREKNSISLNGRVELLLLFIYLGVLYNSLS